MIFQITFDIERHREPKLISFILWTNIYNVRISGSQTSNAERRTPNTVFKYIIRGYF